MVQTRSHNEGVGSALDSRAEWTSLAGRLRERRSRLGDTPEHLLNFMTGISPLLKEAEEALERAAAMEARATP